MSEDCMHSTNLRPRAQQTDSPIHSRTWPWDEQGSPQLVRRNDPVAGDASTSAPTGKRGAGRPRTRPLPDPDAPKPKRGRPPGSKSVPRAPDDPRGPLRTSPGRPPGSKDRPRDPDDPRPPRGGRKPGTKIKPRDPADCWWKQPRDPNDTRRPPGRPRKAFLFPGALAPAPAPAPAAHAPAGSPSHQPLLSLGPMQSWPRFLSSSSESGEKSRGAGGSKAMALHAGTSGQHAPAAASGHNPYSLGPTQSWPNFLSSTHSGASQAGNAGKDHGEVSSRPRAPGSPSPDQH